MLRGSRSSDPAASPARAATPNAIARAAATMNLARSPAARHARAASVRTRRPNPNARSRLAPVSHRDPRDRPAARDDRAGPTAPATSNARARAAVAAVAARQPDRRLQRTAQIGDAQLACPGGCAQQQSRPAGAERRKNQLVRVVLGGQHRHEAGAVALNLDLVLGPLAGLAQHRGDLVGELVRGRDLEVGELDMRRATVVEQP